MSRTKGSCDLRLVEPVDDGELLGYLGVEQAESDAQQRLGQLCQSLLSDERLSALSDSDWVALRDILLAEWPTETFTFAHTSIRCVLAGTGVAEWIRLHFCGAVSGSRPDKELLLVSSNGCTLGLPRHGAAQILRSQSPVACAKPLFVFCVSRLIRRHVLLHAAAVSSNGSVALLVGPTHCGKSTLSMTCHLAGASLLGDDIVAVDKDSGQILPILKSISIRQVRLGRYREVCDIGRMERLLQSERIPVVIDARHFTDPCLSAQTVRSIFVLRGFAPMPRVEPIATGQLLGVLHFQIMADPVDMREAGSGLGKVVGGLSRAYYLCQGPPEETADLVLSMAWPPEPLES